MTASLTPRGHDQHRLEPKRLRDVDTLPPPAAGKPGKRRSRPYRPATRALLSPLKQAQAGAQGTDAAALAKRTLEIFRGLQRELGAQGAARGPSVLAFLLACAEQRAVSQQLVVLAAELGLGSERGLQLLGEAQRAQGRSERSWTGAVAAAGLLRGRAPDPGTTTPAPWFEPDGGSE